MGCIVNGPARQITPTSASACPAPRAPAAPVFIDGEKALTLRGEGIAAEFHKIGRKLHRAPFGTVTPRIDDPAGPGPPQPPGAGPARQSVTQPRSEPMPEHTPATGPPLHRCAR